MENGSKFKTNLDWFSIFLLILALVLFGFSFFAPSIFVKEAANTNLDFTKTGTIGDTIGGTMGPFINLAAVVVTGLAFYMQYRANKLQMFIFDNQTMSNDKQQKQQQFENHFFEMLKLHKENVDELSIISVATGQITDKRDAFRVMASDFTRFLEYLYLENADFEVEYQRAYAVFFWGWASTANDIDEYSHVWQRVREGPEEMDYTYSIDFRSYNGYAAALGHYYRHLFMMVKYVSESIVVDKHEDRMKYLKILRAQLSNHEQIMLFYNWMAEGYGDAWENEDNHYFTKFKIIHNLWVAELFQHPTVANKVNQMIDYYNAHEAGSSPLFEFQRRDFHYKMPVPDFKKAGK
ncbi:putative phage abortive infection protein [Chitinophaga deserti]|uniref:putative phage abortive infection protein n=1 Tax=Chitinophaga deserti TaxID=2164099 RepID=UPI000D6D131F|nr:putative phage abortive infection protein [Chitinophaga deserti]